jgi:hypothetical protein
MAGHRLIDLQFKQDVGVRAKFGGEHHRHQLADKPVVADWLGPAGVAAMKRRRRVAQDYSSSPFSSRC